MILVELRAAEKTRSFHIHVFLPWAREHHAAADPARWFMAEGYRAADELQSRDTLLGCMDAPWRRYVLSYMDSALVAATSGAWTRVKPGAGARRPGSRRTGATATGSALRRGPSSRSTC